MNRLDFFNFGLWTHSDPKVLYKKIIENSVALIFFQSILYENIPNLNKLSIKMQNSHKMKEYSRPEFQEENHAKYTDLSTMHKTTGLAKIDTYLLWIIGSRSKLFQ